MRGEELIGLSPEQEVIGGGHGLFSDLRHHLIPVRPGPAALLEVARKIFLRLSWCLHDTIQRNESQNGEFTNFGIMLIMTSFPIGCTGKAL